MPAIGITGGISTGKSTFCALLGEIMPGATFFDADKIARELTEQDPEVRQEIASEFGENIFSSSGDLNREALRAIAFGDPDKKRALEKILHPRIRRRWSARAEKHRKSHHFFFADIPLLYETGGETLCDQVVVVACSPAVQLARLEGRAPSRPNLQGRHSPRRAGSGHPSIEIEMIRSQMPLNEKISRADHVVWNNGGRDVLKRQTEHLAALWRS